MSKKKVRILEEGTVRSFMRLANLQPLAGRFLAESADEDADDVGGDSDKEELEEVREGTPEDRTRDGVVGDTSFMREGEAVEEGKESEGRPTSAKPKVAGVTKPTKVDSSHPDHKLKPLAQTSAHTGTGPEVKAHNSAPNKKNNSQFELVSEGEEEMGGDMGAVGMGGVEPDMGGAPEELESPDAGGGSVKDAIKKMLDAISAVATEYGVDMAVDSDGGEGEVEPELDADVPPDLGAEAPVDSELPPEEDEIAEQHLEEMIKHLTKRVAARLVKENNKKKS